MSMSQCFFPVCYCRLSYYATCLKRRHDFVALNGLATCNICNWQFGIVWARQKQQNKNAYDRAISSSQDVDFDGGEAKKACPTFLHFPQLIHFLSPLVRSTLLRWSEGVGVGEWS